MERLHLLLLCACNYGFKKILVCTVGKFSIHNLYKWLSFCNCKLVLLQQYYNQWSDTKTFFYLMRPIYWSLSSCIVWVFQVSKAFLFLSLHMTLLHTFASCKRSVHLSPKLYSKPNVLWHSWCKKNDHRKAT